LRERCYCCFRPLKLCYCQTLPQIANKTAVLILQHLGERDHPFNTARIVDRSLNHCQLIAGYPNTLQAQPLPLQPGAGILFPKPGARLLTELQEDELPSQLVLIDGTWGQAKSLYRDVAQLHDLPCYSLAPEKPGEYRIRREPDDQSLSTVEAIAASLEIIEPATNGFPALINAFRQMVDQQLASAGEHESWRRKKSSAATACRLPRSFQQAPGQLVVAYGETSSWRRSGRTARPLNWFAQRLTGEQFQATLQPDKPPMAKALSHMGLSGSDFDNALTGQAFARQWSQFIQPGDTLVVYHPRTLSLLQSIYAETGKAVSLKSIPDLWPARFKSLEELLAHEGLPLPSPPQTPRAAHRLNMAVTLLQHLRAKHLP